MLETLSLCSLALYRSQSKSWSLKRMTQATKHPLELLKHSPQILKCLKGERNTVSRSLLGQRQPALGTLRQ